MNYAHTDAACCRAACAARARCLFVRPRPSFLPPKKFGKNKPKDAQHHCQHPGVGRVCRCGVCAQRLCPWSRRPAVVIPRESETLSAPARSSSAAAMDSEEAEECPLCVEVLTVEDLKFEPCPCGYQVRAGGGG